jgi:hypothetical protein
VAAALLLGLTGLVEAHGVSARDAAFVSGVQGPEPAPFAYLGAKHMVTGYDHLLFLVGVVFFLRRVRDIVTFVSLFTLGHSVTLLTGVIGDVRANAYFIDAVIGLSVVYKGFENIGGFERLGGYRPDARWAVLTFGLFHGFGLATRLQELALPPQGLVANLLSFNVGVELGQGFALAAVLIGLSWWRTRDSFGRHAFAANTLLMAGGFLLVGLQVAGFVVMR